MVYTARNEQRLVFAVHCHDWASVDYNGITLMRRTTAPDYVPVELPRPAAGQTTHPAIRRRDRLRDHVETAECPKEVQPQAVRDSCRL
jgi:hypothetical protein